MTASQLGQGTAHYALGAFQSSPTSTAHGLALATTVSKKDKNQPSTTGPAVLSAPNGVWMGYFWLDQ